MPWDDADSSGLMIGLRKLHFLIITSKWLHFGHRGNSPLALPAEVYHHPGWTKGKDKCAGGFS